MARARASTLGWDDDAFGRFAFGSIEVADVTYEHDVIVDAKRVRKRRTRGETSSW